MQLPDPFICGFVPSLEVLPVLSGAREHGRRLQFKGCPGYGRIIRHLLTGDLQAGILPWELFVSEILTRPGQDGRWAIPLVIQACPMELVLSRAAHRLCFSSRGPVSSREMRRLTFAIEAKRSLSRLQIALWLSAIPGAARPLFKVLPMELMLKGLEAGMMDGIVAPAPWGLLAEAAGCGRLEVPFETGAYAQQVVLVCQQNVCDAAPQICQELPEACAAARRQLTDPAAFLETASWATAAGWPQLTPELLRQSAARYPGPSGSGVPDFAPDQAWLTRELQTLIEWQVLAPKESPATLAEGLLPRFPGNHRQEAGGQPAESPA
jgi:hypothetical protein